ncbi:MAG: helical backbone metal receptor [Bdellovibrionota bacterium]
MTRIISLVPSLTETVCDLGLQENLVGRTKFCVSPKNLHLTVPEIGGTKDPDIEKIVALKPTHILMNVEENTKACRTQLREHKELQNVIFYDSFPKNIFDSIAMVEDIGRLFQKEQVTLEWKNKLQPLLDQCKKIKNRNKTYAYFIWRDPWMVAGQNTYISEMLKLIGFQNVIETGEHLLERYPSIDPLDDRFLSAEYLFFSSEPFPFKQRHIQEFLTLNRGLVFKKMVLVDGQLLSWYGTRSLQGVEYLLRSFG